MDILKDTILVAKGFDSIIHLHAYIYLAQELNIIPQEYSFDYSLNIPFSKRVENEFSILCWEGFIVEVENGMRFKVPAEKLNRGFQVIGTQQISRLEKIASLDPETLINMAHLLYLLKINPELKEQEDRKDFQRKASRTFFMNLTTFNNSFSCLNDILVGGLSGV